MATTFAKAAVLLVGAAVVVVAAMVGSLTGEPQEAGKPLEEPLVDDAAGTMTWPDGAAPTVDRANRPLLELVGITAGSGGGSAIIREKDGDARTYRIGEIVAGGRELVEIHPSHVILRDEQQRLSRLRIAGRDDRAHADPEALRQFADGLADKSAPAEESPPK